MFDIDSIQLIATLKGLRDNAVQEGGDTIDEPVSFFIGAAWTPLGPPEKFRTIRLAEPDVGILQLYTVENQLFGCFRNWTKYQRTRATQTCGSPAPARP